MASAFGISGGFEVIRVTQKCHKYGMGERRNTGRGRDGNVCSANSGDCSGRVKRQYSGEEADNGWGAVGQRHKLMHDEFRALSGEMPGHCARVGRSRNEVGGEGGASDVRVYTYGVHASNKLNNECSRKLAALARFQD
jgi:hypothetical protein